MAVYAVCMARPPKENSRKNNPNFSPVTAQIPKLLGRRLRLFVAQAETTISEVVEEALEEYLDKRGVKLPEESKTESFSELIRSHYFDLMNAGKINPSRLKELAFGHKPTTAELVIIANNLDIPEELVVELRDRTFPKNQTKPKHTNGHT